MSPTAWSLYGADYTRRDGPRQEWLGYPNFRDVRNLDRVFEDVAIYNDFFPTLTGRGDAETITGGRVSYGYFSRVLRVEPALGRGLLAEDDVPGAAPVVLLSHGFWTRRFGEDPSVIGNTVTFDDEPYTVVGVMPQDFRQPFIESTEFWTPQRWNDTEHGGGRASAILRSIGRLQPGVTIESARSEATALGTRLEAEYPESNTGVGYTVLPLHDNLVEQASTALWVLLGAVGFVLLLVCVNLANLLLARGTARQSELAVRAALGAGRKRIVGQLLTESVLLAVIGGVLGVGVAFLGTEFLVQIVPDGAPRIGEVAVDGRVLAFTAVATLAAGVLFGLVPSIRATGADLRDSLSQGGRGGSPGGPGRRLRGGLVAGQVALALVLLVGAGLLLRSFQALRNVDLGFNPENVVTFGVNLPEARYPDMGAVRVYQSGLHERVGALPGVVAVGAINSLPMGGFDGDTDFDIEGRPSPEPGQESVVWIRRVTPGYFDAIGLQVRTGRAFDSSDREGNAPVVVVNETLAEQFFGDDGAVGKRVNVNDPMDPTWREIVGVARDVKNFGVRGDSRNAMYFPTDQLGSRFLTLVVRTSGDPAGVIPSLRAEVGSTDPSLALTMTSMESVVDRSLAPDRFVTTLVSLFALVALVLAAVGLYGVVSYSVTRRMREMGVRIALGAAGSEIGRLVVGRSLMLAGLGIAIGLVGAFAVTRVLTGLLFGRESRRPHHIRRCRRCARIGVGGGKRDTGTQGIENRPGRGLEGRVSLPSIDTPPAPTQLAQEPRWPSTRLASESNERKAHFGMRIYQPQITRCTSGSTRKSLNITGSTSRHPPPPLSTTSWPRRAADSPAPLVARWKRAGFRLETTDWLPRSRERSRRKTVSWWSSGFTYATGCSWTTQSRRRPARRAHEIHPPKCPVYKTVSGCIDVTTELEVVPPLRPFPGSG